MYIFSANINLMKTKHKNKQERKIWFWKEKIARKRRVHGKWGCNRVHVFLDSPQPDLVYLDPMYLPMCHSVLCTCMSNEGAGQTSWNFVQSGTLEDTSRNTRPGWGTSKKMYTLVHPQHCTFIWHGHENVCTENLNMKFFSVLPFYALPVERIDTNNCPSENTLTHPRMSFMRQIRATKNNIICHLVDIHTVVNWIRKYGMKNRRKIDFNILLGTSSPQIHTNSHTHTCS